MVRTCVVRSHGAEAHKDREQIRGECSQGNQHVHIGRPALEGMVGARDENIAGAKLDGCCQQEQDEHLCVHNGDKKIWMRGSWAGV